MLQCMKRRLFSCSRFHVRLFVFDLQNASLHLQALKITLVCVYRISSHGKMSATYSWLRGWDMKISCVTSLQRSTEPTWRRSCGLSQSFMKGWEHILSTYRPIHQPQSKFMVRYTAFMSTSTAGGFPILSEPLCLPQNKKRESQPLLKRRFHHICLICCSSKSKSNRSGSAA